MEKKRNLTIRVDEDCYRDVRIRLAASGMSLQQYIMDMISRDLDTWKKEGGLTTIAKE